MPMIKIQDSDGKEQMLIGPAVFGISINSFGMFVSKMICVKDIHLQILISAIIKNLSDVYPKELKKAIKEVL